MRKHLPIWLSFRRGTIEVEVTADDPLFPATKFMDKGEARFYRSRWKRDGAKACDVLTEFKNKDAWVLDWKMHVQDTT